LKTGNPTVSSILESKELLNYISNDAITSMANEIAAGKKRLKKIKDFKAQAFILTSITK